MMDNETLTITDNRTQQTYTVPIIAARSAPWICGRSKPAPTISA